MIVVVPSGGAETIASRFVTCESCSVVVRIASSSSRRTTSALTFLCWTAGSLPSLITWSTYWR